LGALSHLSSAGCRDAPSVRGRLEWLEAAEVELDAERARISDHDRGYADESAAHPHPVEQVDPALPRDRAEEAGVPRSGPADGLHADAVPSREPAARAGHEHRMLLGASVQARELDGRLVAIGVLDGHHRAHLP